MYSWLWLCISIMTNEKPNSWRPNLPKKCIFQGRLDYLLSILWSCNYETIISFNKGFPWFFLKSIREVVANGLCRIHHRTSTSQFLLKKIPESIYIYALYCAAEKYIICGFNKSFISTLIKWKMYKIHRVASVALQAYTHI